ncbi:DNA repair protein RecN [Neptuniibacter pectenicola]|jgi:DNA repair protein RecN (Recombination protein N)|uniref:DNA repair protein RecN n=1 Tax=Neptuniibacter pectenicola TaxID=1806669 RepID=UPI000798DCFE|nr:DNA repair protein RecN [Neptuniibacter pectenicola]KXJ57805.1 MAG: DNA repair protein RecN [Neptuniibacter sp. Phe_28]
MLNQLTIRDFAIVESLDLELNQGMTVVSGETGAGKSIMLDALGLTLGNRAETGTVRLGAEKADITASFNIAEIPSAEQWLRDNDLDNCGECILRRVITKEGRSRCYINGRPSPANSVKALGEHLIAIHGQHEHQRLLKKDHHRTLLDDFSGLTKLAEQTRQAFQHWSKLNTELTHLSEQSTEQTARIQLLSYQIEELDQLALHENELKQLEQEQKTLANAGEILSTGHQFISLASEDESSNCVQSLNQCRQLLANIQSESPSVRQAAEMLDSALIQVEEASTEMRHYLERVEVNPTRQLEVEERLSTIFEIARKHRIKPDEITTLHQTLQQEFASLSRTDEELEQLEKAVETTYAQLIECANKLSEKRRKGAKQLSKLVDQQLHSLGMPAASLTVQLSPLERPTAHGMEDVEFLIVTNQGQPAKPLGKIASGGELSRISLAIQVITAQTSTTPTLIFDEVDVGIGGAIAEVVGKLLKKLGESAQILCVTHQPQVASQGHQHLFVSKRSDKQQTHTQIDQLTEERRIEEIARMLGGISITERSIEHAREMLDLQS